MEKQKPFRLVVPQETVWRFIKLKEEQVETYKIVRFRKNNSGARRVMRRGLTLEEAKAHCSREDTQKRNRNGEVVWFDGFAKEGG